MALSYSSKIKEYTCMHEEEEANTVFCPRTQN